MNGFQVTPLEDTPGVDDFVLAHPKGSVFHTRAMCRAFAAAPENKVYATVARDDTGAIRALLAAVRVATVRGCPGRFASRSIMYAEPICTDDEDGREALAELLRRHNSIMSQCTLFAEVRPLFLPGREQEVLESQEYRRLGYNNYELSLATSVEELWNQLKAKCRSGIRSSEKKGLAIRQGDFNTDLDVFYSLLEQSYGRSKVPLADKALFVAVDRELPPEQLRLTIAECGGEPIASVCHLIFGGRMYSWYAGIVRTKGVAANTCLVWDAIQWGVKHGQKIYDFGGAGWVGEYYGPGRFKSQFGGTLVSYDRYRRVYARWALRLAETTYDRTRRFLAPSVSTRAPRTSNATQPRA